MFLLQQTTHRMVIRYDPEVGHLYVPDLRARIPHERGGYFVATNSQGFRSDVEFIARPSGRRRILFFGDSFTAGDGCRNDERFPERVGDALNAEIYNYAVSGTGTDQQLLIYERFAASVAADLIVICVYVENIERIKVAFRESIDRVSGRRLLVPKPYFTIEDETLALHHVPVPLERPLVDDTAADRFQGLDRRAFDPLQTFVYKPLQRFKGNAALETLRLGVKRRLPGLMPALLRRSNFQPHADYRSAGTEGWRLMQAILTRFTRAAAPTPVLIVPVPEYYFYHDGLDPLYQPLFAQLAAAEPHVHVMDLTRPLYRLAWADKKRIAFPHDTHFSPFGHEQVAQIVADAIRSRGLLPAAPDKAPQAAGGTFVAAPASDATSAHASRPTAAAARGVRPTRRAAGTYVLGISAFYHDSAAALIRDGDIVAAAEEERFSRVKNDRRFPAQAVNYCLEEAGIDQGDLDAVVYYDNASLTFERLMHTLASVGADGREAWGRILPTWLRQKLHIPQIIRKQLVYDGLILQEQHHRSHAASAFYPSPFERAAIVTIDGVGEWATGSIGVGCGSEVTLLEEMRFPNSIGLLYSAFTQFTGFKVNSGEYKMMGLAPYGEPRYVDAILNNLVDLKQDGSVELNMDCFAFLSQPTMTNDRFASLFGGPARKPEGWLTQREMDIARSIQVVTEEAVLRTVRHAHELTGEQYVCLAGGVALNCVANGRVLREGPFEDVWIQPAAGDAGCALGAALDVYHTYFGRPRTRTPDGRSRQGGSYLGPGYSDQEISAFLTTHGHPHTRLDPSERAGVIARLLDAGKVIGHMSGRLEFGPRSLGARAIIGDARNEEMQQTLNLKIKYRESFRPFAPSVLAERVSEYFDLDRESPYMLLVAPVCESRRKPFVREGDDLTAIVRTPRSDLPAITHVDYSARVQTVVRGDHPEYYDVINAFAALTGCGVIVNTSFNVRGEPIVCSPDDAYRCFMRTGMDHLVLGNVLLNKQDQPAWNDAMGHVEEDEHNSVGPTDSAEFDAALAKAFDSEFLPALASLSADHTGALGRSRHAPTTWEDARGAAVGARIFDVPRALDSGSPDPVEMAAAITACWQPGATTKAMRGVLVKLLELSARFPPPADSDSGDGVAHTLYMMY
jgi:carbamoyltransferase